MPSTPSVLKRPLTRKELVDSLNRTARAHLRQSVWEATQFMSFEEIREYVKSVLREVESDEP